MRDVKISLPRYFLCTVLTPKLIRLKCQKRKKKIVTRGRWGWKSAKKWHVFE